MAVIKACSFMPTLYRVDRTHWESLRHGDLRQHIVRVRVLVQALPVRHLPGKASSSRVNPPSRAASFRRTSEAVKHRSTPEPRVSGTTREARSQGVAIISTAAVLVLAKERNLIPACGPLLLSLREQGYFLSDALVAAVLAEGREG